jgi:hypothetical protein
MFPRHIGDGIRRRILIAERRLREYAGDTEVGLSKGFSIMVVKWIRCTVRPDNRDSFSEAQSKWSTICSASGFLAQHGGWDIKSELSTACIVAGWSSIVDYERFMATLHDTVFDRSNQVATYSHIDVDVCDVVLPMAGEALDLTAGIELGGSLLRVAECSLHPHRVDHLVQAQRDVWVPGMCSFPGMLGGWFLRSRSNPRRFFVMSAWRTMEEHTSYVSNRVPQLRAQADVANDVAELTGRLIGLEPTWSVVAQRVQK